MNLPFVGDVVYLFVGMEKLSIEDEVAQDRPPTSDTSRARMPSMTMRSLEEDDIDNGAHHPEVEGDSIDDKMLPDSERPTTPPSPNPWSTSATLPVSQEPHESQPAAEMSSTQPTEGISPTPWSTSATLPVSPGSESHGVEEESKATTPPPKEAKKKVFSTAEYKVAFSHFFVSR